MIFKEVSDTFLPCNKEFVEVEICRNIDFSNMIHRKESNGVDIYFDKTQKAVYFKSKDTNVFPLDLPVQVDMELTQSCNLNCKHCFVNDRNSFFSDKTFDVIKKLANAGVIRFELIGGEPLLVKEIFNIIEYLNKSGKIVSLSTNGTLITEDIAKKLYLNLPSKIFVSLDGPKEINDFIRGEGSFDKSLQGIKNLNKFGIIPTISFCINKINLSHIEKFCEEISAVKIKGIFFIFGEKINKNSDFNNNFFDHSDREMVTSKISKLNIPFKITMHFAQNKNNALYYGCFFKLTMCEVTSNGDVLSCPIIRKKEGNIFVEDLKVIWKRMQYNLFNNKPHKCKNCVWKSRCFPCEFDNI